jgi:hypothetical protein
MTAQEIAQLAIAATQIHANLRALEILSKEPVHSDLQQAAEIVAAASKIAHGATKIPHRFRNGPGDISVDGMWKQVQKHVPPLAIFITAHLAQSQKTPELARVTKNRIMALGLILDGILACDNVRRALLGDLSRRVTALPPADDLPPTLIVSKPDQQVEKMNAKVNLQLPRLPADLKSIMSNLQALAEEVEQPPFDHLTVAELIGYILNVIANHVQLPPRRAGGDTSTSREWIKRCAQECLERSKQLYSILLHPPTEETAIQEYRVTIVRELVHVFITLRDIYLAPDVQEALRRADAQAKS